MDHGKERGVDFSEVIPNCDAIKQSTVAICISILQLTTL